MSTPTHTHTARHAYIEPGLLSLFRLSNVLLLLYAGGDVLGAIFGWNTLNIWSVMGTCLAIFMMVYVYAGWIERLLGHFYLLTGVVILSIVLIIIHLAQIAWYMDGRMPDEREFESLILFAGLFIPSVLFTVQYSFRTMLVFTAVTAIVPMLMIYLFWFDLPIEVREPIWGDTVARVVVYPIVGFFVMRLVSGQQDERKRLAALNSQLRQYATTVERLATSHERNRLARDLHDTLAHTLSAVAVQVEALNKQLERDPASAHHTVQQLRDLTRSGLQESRRALQALRASPLEDLGFALAMQQLVDSTAERSGIVITLELIDDLDDLTLEIEQSLYRITEEALNNTVRHANAHTATVALHRAGGELCLSITDDGTGFDPDTVESNGHYGLTGMRERALLCNGKLEIQSAPMTGTTVRLTVGGSEQ